METDKNPGMTFDQKLLAVSNSLGAKELRMLKFLAIDHLGQAKVDEAKESALPLLQALQQKVVLREKDPTFLIEFLQLIEKNKILENIGLYRVGEVKSGKISPYRLMLFKMVHGCKGINILSHDDVRKIACYFGLQNINFAEDIFLKLQENKTISVDNVKKLKQCLEDGIIQRNDLAELVHEYMNPPDAACVDGAGVCPDDSETDGETQQIFIDGEDTEETISCKFKCYKMDSNPRGICVIINNQYFPEREKGKQERHGSQKDADSLEKVWKKLGFRVLPLDDYKNLTAEDMKLKLKKVAELNEHSKNDCFVCCILSHGGEGPTVSGTDDKEVPIRDLTSYFQANNCHGLAGKPKLFFFQACQGSQIQKEKTMFLDHDTSGEGMETEMETEMELDVPSVTIPNDADFLFGYATIHGFASGRTSEGSLYIKKLTEALTQDGEKLELQLILLKVNQAVALEKGNVTKNKKKIVFKQIPAPVHTLRKGIIFKKLLL